MFQAYVEINLSILKSNYRKLAAAFPGVTMSPVIKSDAYGHGAVNVARALSEIGVRHFCVFTVEEAQELRAAGITARLFVLEGALPDEVAEAAKLENVALAVWNLETIQALSSYAVAHHCEFQVHLKLDTGMSRLGFFPAQVPTVLEVLKRTPGVKLCGAFSHLASADDPASPETAEQVAAFRGAVALLPPGCPEVHLCAAPGLMANAAPEFKYARPGVVLYGYGADARHPELKFDPVMSFKSRLISVKLVPRGARISYGGTYLVMPEAQKIGVVPVGYSNGYSRGLAASGRVLVHGQRVPIRGRICMGMFMVDVSAIPGVAAGDEVVLLGQQGEERITADELAKLLHTISYEILCAFGKNAHRVCVN